MELKYKNNKLVAKFIAQKIYQSQSWNNSKYHIVDTPIGKNNLSIRKYNQCTLIAQYLTKIIHNAQYYDIFYKEKDFTQK